MSCALLGVAACVDDCVGGLPCQNVYRSATPGSFTVNIGQCHSCVFLFSVELHKFAQLTNRSIEFSLCSFIFLLYTFLQCSVSLLTALRFYGKPVTKTIMATTTICDGTRNRTCLKLSSYMFKALFSYGINKAHFSDSWRHPITGLHLTLSLCANCILLSFHSLLTNTLISIFHMRGQQ